MGVPKFYRWISERYPCLSEVISDTEIPEFDNLYLDMNGIIHNCSHPNDDDVHFRISQEQIFADIFAYIDKLFNIIRPKKVFFLAVDGVAPRAKMNQQRARRFMSARTAEEQLQAHLRKGEEVPKEKRFDSNCITPGTLFMAELHKELSKWLETKVEKDQAWHGIRVYLSGHDCPGEGEHKIMDFIRHERTLDDYDSNTRHCMYGLDADLLMLGICSHEPHFSLLREEVKFNRPPPKKAGAAISHRANPSQINFHLLHLSLLREYLYWEFYPLKASLPFPYDIEHIIDDWVLMGFLVGNDFIPHLPHVHIHDDALPLLYQTYIEVLPSLGGYINESGILNLERFEIFLKAFAANDRRHFLQTLEDESFLRSKTGRDPHKLSKEEQMEEELQLSATESSDDADEADEISPDDEAAFVSSDEEEDDSDDTTDELPDGGVQSAAELLSRLNADSDGGEDDLSEAIMAAELRGMDDKEFENDVENCWTKTVSNSFRRHKRLYYREKMKYENITKSELRQQAEGYVRAIQWNLHYYYKGCVSWNWFYPHHYSPYISDVVDFSKMDMNFDLGEPFKPFEQLLAVLPSASAECLPSPFRDLMCNKESPIADFYPTDFRTDLNGKKNDWEAVVLIPFIDEARLLSAVQSKMELLTPEEKARNSIGEILLFSFSAKDSQIRTPLPVNAFHLDQQQVIWGLLPNVKLDVFFPGFPTMKHLPHSAQLKQVNVKVFQQESKRPSMVLTIGKRKELEKKVSDIATDFIGKEVCIDWPILKMGLVDSIWAEGNKYTRLETGEVTVVALDADEQEVMKSMLYSQKERMLSRFAIDVKNANTIVFVRRFVGVTYIVEQGVLRPQKQWAGPQAVVPVLLPLLVTDINVEGGVSLRDIPVSEAYPKHSKVFAMLPSWEGFGYPALVDMVDPEGRVRLTVSIWPSVDLCTVRDDYEALRLQWMNSFDAGRKIGVDGRLLSRITGTVFLIIERDTGEEGASRVQEKLNIGLALKLSKRNQEVADYTRRLENGYWQYSMLCVQLLNSYRNKFRDLFAFLENSHTVDDAYLASDVWTNEEKRNQRVAELKEWLANTPTNGAEKQDGGKKYADRLIIGQIENAIKQVPKKRWGFRKCAVNPSVLYRAELYNGRCCADPDADFQLLDRVVYTVQGSAVPFGSQGTVVGILSGKVDVLFDHEFNNGFKIRGAMNSGACVPNTSLINITYGKERKGRKPAELPVGSEKRLTAGKENVSSKQKKTTTEARSTVSEAPYSLLTRNPKKDQTIKGAPISSHHSTMTSTPSANSSVISSENAAASATTLSSSSNANARQDSTMPLPMTAIISKEQMEDELNRMLGLRTPKNAATEQSQVSSILSSLTFSASASDKNRDVWLPKPEKQSPPTALTKLFSATATQYRNENQVVQKLLSGAKEDDMTKRNVRPDYSYQRGGTPNNRGGGQRRAPIVQNRHVVPTTPLFPTRPPPANRDFFGSSRVQTNSPKLTDLKPSSVVLPCRPPLRRRGGKQQGGPVSSPPSQPRDTDAVEVTSSTTTPSIQARAAVNKNRRARKSRLAPKFAEGN